MQERRRELGEEERITKVRTPTVLWAAAGILWAQTLVPLILRPSLVAGSAVLVGALIAGALVRGSRIAWIVALAGSAVQLMSAALSGEGFGAALIGLAVFVLLLTPGSRRFVWASRVDEDGTRRFRKYGRGIALWSWMFEVIARIADWDTSQRAGDSGEDRSYSILLWRLGGVCVAMLLAVGATYQWEQGSGEHSSVVKVIANITWTGYALVQVSFLAVLLLAAYRHVVGPMQTELHKGTARRKRP